MKTVRFILMLSLFGTLSFQVMAKPTVVEFGQEILAHRSRVKANSILIYNQFSNKYPQLFPTLRMMPDKLREQLMDVYYDTHDAPKNMTMEELMELGYIGEKPILEELHDIWGEAKRPPIINELNRVEEIYKIRLLKKLFPQLDEKFLNAAIREMQYPEHIADFTDTKLKRGPELGFEAKPLDAYYLFKDRYHDNIGAAISMWLEVNVYERSKAKLCRSLLNDGNVWRGGSFHEKGRESSLNYGTH